MAPQNVLRLLAGILLIILNPSLAVFVNIDCGSNAPYTDDLSIAWTADDAYVHNGESAGVEYSSTVPSYMSETVMSTLRVFTTLKKNCYNINVGKGEKVLVRASFFYGNYDGKDSPPTFELQFDGNFWATVNTSSLRGVYHEAIYVTKANTTSICVAQTLPGQIPFISALELRSLDLTMYSRVDSGHALFLSYRANAGSNFTIRYPDDAYDRIWGAEGGFVIIKDVLNEAKTIDVSKAEDKPPVAVLRDASTTIGTIWGMVLNTELPATSESVYVTTYFSEVTQLSSRDSRSIEVQIDGHAYSKPIIPPFGGVSVLSISNRTANSNINISIIATASSTLPPLINAYEVYTISDTLADGTNSDDVKGLAALQKNFDVLQKWSGDPCLPSSFSWEWLECNSDASPRVIALSLSSFGLSGALPDFSSLTALETIDLRNNNLYGPIPSFLGLLPNLKLLNLADNRFSGTIPSSLSKNKNLQLIVTGNCLSGMSCPSSSPFGKTPSAGPPPYGTLPPKDGLPQGVASGSEDQTGGAEVGKLSLTLITIFPVCLLWMLMRNF